MQNDSRGAGIATRGRGPQTFVDVGRKKNLGKKPATIPKASGFRSSPLSRPSDSQYAGKDDPLSLREPPQGSGFDSGVQLYFDGDYLNADVHPDSLLADVEALFVQERMLTEQVKWWQERARREQTAKDGLQAALQTQEDTSKQELLDLQRRIAACRDEQRHEDQLRQGLQSEAAELRAEAKDAQQQADELRAKLEEMANQSSPQTAVKIRAAINGALFSTQASPRTAQKAFMAKPKGLRKTAQTAQKGLSADSFGGGMGSDEVSDDDNDMNFPGGSGGAGAIILRPAQGDQGGSTDSLGILLRPPPVSFGGSGGSLGLFTGMGLDEDDDDEFGGMFGDQSLDLTTILPAGGRR